MCRLPAPEDEVLVVDEEVLEVGKVVGQLLHLVLDRLLLGPSGGQGSASVLADRVGMMVPPWSYPPKRRMIILSRL